MQRASGRLRSCGLEKAFTTFVFSNDYFTTKGVDMFKTLE